MQLGSWLRNTWSTTPVQDLAESLAIRCVEPTWGRIHASVLSMSLAESRGYIRARAALVLHQGLLALRQEQPQLSQARSERIAELAAEMLVDQLERRIFECRRQAHSRRERVAA